MKTIKLDEMDNKRKNIYTIIDNNTRSWDIKVKKTKWGNGVSKNSYSFDIKDIENKYKDKKIEVISDYLKKTFEINESEFSSFDRAITQVCSGSGNEAEKITVLLSSSLCCLLFFYNIKEKPIEIDLGNNNIVRFNRAFFEVQNEVINNTSNVDVVLVSENKKTVLFLESKFAEYYLYNGCYHISTQYLDHRISKTFYNTEIMNSFNFTIKTKKDGTIEKKTDEDGYETFCVDSKKTINKKCKGYVEGVKQMMSHYIGVDNFLENKQKIIKQINDVLELPNDIKVFLGEIMFNFQDNTDMVAYLQDYEDKYFQLKEHLTSNKNIILLPKVLHYSDYKNRLNAKIRQFYYGDK